jgi:hypothetical protein
MAGNYDSQNCKLYLRGSLLPSALTHFELFQFRFVLRSHLCHHFFNLITNFVCLLYKESMNKKKSSLRAFLMVARVFCDRQKCDPQFVRLSDPQFVRPIQNASFVRPIHKMRHLSDLYIKCVICPT